MAKYKIEVIRRGTIVVDGVDNLEDAMEDVEGSNPIDDIEWSDFVQSIGGEEI